MTLKSKPNLNIMPSNLYFSGLNSSNFALIFLFIINLLKPINPIIQFLSLNEIVVDYNLIK